MSNPFDLPGFDDDNNDIVSEEFVPPGLYTDLSNEDYHAASGISKSGLDWIAKNPSNYPWSKAAPLDVEKLDALDEGQALHTLLLEPDEFERRFIVMPELNLRTNAGKAERDEFLAQAEADGKTILDYEFNRKLHLMRESALAHPTIKMLMEADGQNETSIFWNDDETSELCKCRPDRTVWHPNLGPIIVDVKKCTDITRFEKHAEEFRYHVQNAMYRDGFHSHHGETPEFWFLVIDSTVSAGRYRVDVIELDEEWLSDGHDIYRKNLHTYHNCRASDDWEHIRTINRPRWASRY